MGKQRLFTETTPNKTRRDERGRFRKANLGERTFEAEGDFGKAKATYEGDVKVEGLRDTGPNRIKENITSLLKFNANVMKQWLIDNNRVATGRAVNSITVVVEDAPTTKIAKNLSKLVRNMPDVNVDVNGGEAINPKQVAREARALFDHVNIGWVNGKITAVPYFKYAMQGRGPGRRPPVSAILAWMGAKGVVGRFGDRDSAYVIARKIGEKGTAPPHFNKRIQTAILGASTSKMIKKNAGLFANVVGNGFLQFLGGVMKVFEHVEFTRR